MAASPKVIKSRGLLNDKLSRKAVPEARQAADQPPSRRTGPPHEPDRTGASTVIEVVAASARGAPSLRPKNANALFGRERVDAAEELVSAEVLLHSTALRLQFETLLHLPGRLLHEPDVPPALDRLVGEAVVGGARRNRTVDLLNVSRRFPKGPRPAGRDRATSALPDNALYRPNPALNSHRSMLRLLQVRHDPTAGQPDDEPAALAEFRDMLVARFFQAEPD